MWQRFLEFNRRQDAWLGRHPMLGWLTLAAVFGGIQIAISLLVERPGLPDDQINWVVVAIYITILPTVIVLRARGRYRRRSDRG
jgi:hypothetical protein